MITVIKFSVNITILLQVQQFWVKYFQLNIPDDWRLVTHLFMFKSHLLNTLGNIMREWFLLGFHSSCICRSLFVSITLSKVTRMISDVLYLVIDFYFIFENNFQNTIGSIMPKWEVISNFHTIFSQRDVLWFNILNTLGGIMREGLLFSSLHSTLRQLIILLLILFHIQEKSK